MRIYNSKRASTVRLIMHPIAHTLLALLVGFVMLTALKNMTDKTDFERQYISKDIFLMVNSLYSMPETVFLNYTSNTKNLSLAFSKDMISIWEKNKPEQAIYFVGSKKIKLNQANIKQSPYILLFLKQSNLIDINNKGIILDNKNAVCPSIEKDEKLNEKSFIFIANDSTKEVIESLKNQYYPNHPSFEIFGKTSKTDFDISIELEKSNNANELLVYYTAGNLKNRVFSCFVFNQIVNSIKLDNAQLIPIDASFFKVNGKDLSVKIILHSNYQKSIVSSMNKGINDYFEG